MSSSQSYQIQKRLLDLAVAAVLTLIFLPVWLVIPVLIYLDSGWPIIFKHRRMGKDGVEFTLYKFRSMINNAEAILHKDKHNRKLLEKFKQSDWKVEAKEDPRITRLGRILRSLTIDEFPQLYNVWRGDMSMIGPRAYLRNELLEQTHKYPETKAYIHDILSIKPGITGPWQTSGRNEIPFAQRAKMDAAYARNQSIWTDIKILFRTPKAMISKW